MIRSAVTISLVSEVTGGPFVFWDDLRAGCAEAAGLGFHGVEIFPRSIEDLNAKVVRQILTEYNLTLAAMGTGAGWVVHKLRLTDPGAQQRARARAFVAGIIDFAGSFGAPAIIGSMQGRSEAGVDREQAFNWLREHLEQFGPRAHAMGVPVLLEPLNRYETNLVKSVADGLELLKPLRTRNIKLLVDLFHANIEETEIAEAIRLAGSDLGYVHFADSNRQAMGLGHTDMTPIMEALQEIGYAGYVSAEILPLPDSEAAAQQTMESYRRWFCPD